METNIGRHTASAEPRVLVVDGSKVVRRMITRVLEAGLDGARVIACADAAEAKAALAEDVVDFVTVALRLPDMDGLELAGYIRAHVAQAYVPIVVVSGDVDARLRERALGADVTDYFDKSLGYPALVEFIRGYVDPPETIEGMVLYIEDSRVVALATRRMLEKYGLTVQHVTNGEDALALLDTAQAQGEIGADIVLSDVTLKGELDGSDLLQRVREHYGYGKGRLPVLVMTGDDNAERQTNLIRMGANDLVEKPVEEKLLLTKLMFQLGVARRVRESLDG